MRAPNMAGAGSQAGGERGWGQLLIPRGSVPLAAPAAPQPHSDSHPAVSSVRTGLRWRMTSHPGSPPCRGEDNRRSELLALDLAKTWAGCTFMTSR